MGFMSGKEGGGIEAMAKNLMLKLGFSPEVLQKYVTEFLALLQGLKNGQDKHSADLAQFRNEIVSRIETLERKIDGRREQRLDGNDEQRPFGS